MTWEQPKGQASRWQRWWARFIDSTIILPGSFVWFFKPYGLKLDPPPVVVVLMLIYALTVIIIQTIMLTRSGQSLGKRIVGIRIISAETGMNPGFIKNCVLREGILGLVLVPFIGKLLHLLNIGLIFGENRMCGHDLILGTLVIQGKQPAVGDPNASSSKKRKKAGMPSFGLALLKAFYDKKLYIQIFRMSKLRCFVMLGLSAFISATVITASSIISMGKWMSKDELSIFDQIDRLRITEGTMTMEPRVRLEYFIPQEKPTLKIILDSDQSLVGYDPVSESVLVFGREGILLKAPEKSRKVKYKDLENFLGTIDITKASWPGFARKVKVSFAVFIEGLMLAFFFLGNLFWVLAGAGLGWLPGNGKPGASLTFESAWKRATYLLWPFTLLERTLSLVWKGSHILVYAAIFLVICVLLGWFVANQTIQKKTMSPPLIE